MCSTKRRDYRFSLKNFTEVEYNQLLNLECRYIILGKEISKDEEIKLQGYIYFKSSKTFNSIKNLVSKVEIEILNKKRSLIYEYFSKLNNLEERGELPNNHGGKKPGLKQIFKPKEFEKSFAFHEKAKFWSSLNKVKPEEVSLNSHKKYWFDCDRCKHSYESILNNINANNAGCPYCYNRKLCGKEDCILCFNKSFASHEKTEFWSSKNDINPILINKGTEKKYWFNCNNCNHELLISLKQISTKNHWCIYCSHQKLCKEEKCSFCFENSFASIINSKYWNKNLNKGITPRETFKNTNNKFWFDCNDCGNNFYKRISDISSKSTWCSICTNKTELKLYKILVQKYKEIEKGFNLDNCKNIKHLPFDFVLLEIKIIIELDGSHHFRQVSNWGNFEENQKRDIYKMKCANENGFSVIRLLQEDVLFDKYDWLHELVKNIDKITLDNHVQNIYMGLNDEYKDFVI
jgi:very-short-patch-repair endonuclease